MSCQPSRLSQAEMQTWLRTPNNGCTKSKSIGPWEIQATYRPSNLVALQSWKAESKLGTLAESYLDSLRVDLDQFTYFNLQVSANGKEAEAFQATKASFSERVQLFSFQMKPYVSLIYDNKDTLDAIHYTYDRTFGMGGATNFLFVFDRNESSEAKKMQFYLRDIGLGFGAQKLSFELADIRNSRTISVD